MNKHHKRWMIHFIGNIAYGYNYVAVRYTKPQSRELVAPSLAELKILIVRHVARWGW